MCIEYYGVKSYNIYTWWTSNDRYIICYLLSDYRLLHAHALLKMCGGLYSRELYRVRIPAWGSSSQGGLKGGISHCEYCTVYSVHIHYTVINIYMLCKAACTKLYIYIFKYGKQDFLLAFSDTVYWILIIFLVQCMYVLRTKGGRTFCAKNKVIFHQQMCWSIVVFTNKRSQAKVYTMYFGISSI